MLVKHSLEEAAYDASLAGLDYEINSETDGLHLKIRGYSDKVPVFMKRILERVRDIIIDPAAFDVVHEQVSWNKTSFYSF